jgi:hypothetical protein
VKNGAAWYAAAVSYAAHGGLRSLMLGNGVAEEREYNRRLQTTLIRATKVGIAQPLLSLSYGWGGAENNGNPRTQTVARGA